MAASETVWRKNRSSAKFKTFEAYKTRPDRYLERIQEEFKKAMVPEKFYIEALKYVFDYESAAAVWIRENNKRFKDNWEDFEERFVKRFELSTIRSTEKTSTSVLNSNSMEVSSFMFSLVTCVK